MLPGHRLVFFGILIFSIISNSFSKAQTQEECFVYVWDFSTTDSTLFDLAKYITADFEEALVNSYICTVLDRRNFSRIYTHRISEEQIFEIEQIPNTALHTLKSLQANVVVFGMVDSIKNEKVRITVTFQKFDTRKLLIESTFVERDLLFNSIKRKEAMKKLVYMIFKKHICPEPPEWSLAIPGLHHILRGDRKSGLKFFVGDALFVCGLYYCHSKYNNRITKMQNSISQEEANRCYDEALKWQSSERVMFYTGTLILFGWELIDYFKWKKEVRSSINNENKYKLKCQLNPSQNGFLLSLALNF